MPANPSPRGRQSMNAPMARQGLMLFCFLWAHPAQASIEYRSLYLQRDFMLFLAALLTLVLFYVLRGNNPAIRMRPIGRRLSDLTRMANPGNNGFARWENDSVPSWDVRAIDAFMIQAPRDCLHWNITLFRCERIVPRGRFSSASNGFFLLAPTMAQAEEVLGPMERKVYHRFRNCFAGAKIVQERPSRDDTPCFTWYPSLEPLQELVLQFLTMCLAISEDIQLEGSMTFHRGSSFWVEVSWPEVPELENLEVQLEEQDSMEVIRGSERVGIRLHLSVPEHVLVVRPMQAQKRSA